MHGTRCYTDATWNNGQTGLGIFFHIPTTHNAIFIKATTLVAQSPLHAELMALQLAMELVKLLNIIEGANFLTGNVIIADSCKKKRNFEEEPGHWSLRPIWSQICSRIPECLLQVS